ncbi:O-antigen polymerase [Paucilactobacillus kaifaensis]|uniref:O-antigen polymerase n=1 Tax=Paucilactobacillus kaifaensis TaxID=2559921 RepID=UPI0010F981D1|nr:O-antigen polymerase [Paucilactobacillus kaifaensis]
MLVFMLALLLIIAVVLHWKINLTNPMVIFLGTWILVFIIVYENIFANFYHLSLKTVLFVLISIFFVVFFFRIGKKLGITMKIVYYNLNRLAISANILGCIVIFAFIITWIKLGPPPLLGSSIDRANYYVSGIELLYQMLYVALFLNLFLWKKGYSSGLVINWILIFSVFTALRGNKTGIFLIILMFLYFFGKKVDVFKIVLLFLGIISVFYFVSFIYLNSVANENLLKDLKMSMTGYQLPTQLYVLYDPLIYMVNNIYNLNGLINQNLGGIGLGSISFPGITQIFDILFNHISIFKDSVSSQMTGTLQFLSINTFSGLGKLYVDFGLFLSEAFMCVIGFVSGVYFYNLMYASHDISIIHYYMGLILYETLSLSFFTFYMGNIEVFINLIVLFIIHLFSVKGR